MSGTADPLANDKHGQSMHVRLTPPGIPGKWCDEATGEHGDLLDIIRISISASELRDAIVEGHRFLSLPFRPPTETLTARSPTGCRTVANVLSMGLVVRRCFVSGSLTPYRNPG